MSSTIDRRQILTALIVDFLTDWTDDLKSLQSVKTSIEAIESYGVKFDFPDGQLVRAAIRHLKDVVNPWNKESIPDVLHEMGFLVEESQHYWETLYDNA